MDHTLNAVERLYRFVDEPGIALPITAAVLLVLAIAAVVMVIREIGVFPVMRAFAFFTALTMASLAITAGAYLIKDNQQISRSR